MKRIQGYWEDLAQINDSATDDRFFIIQRSKEKENDDITHYFKFYDHGEKSSFIQRFKQIRRLKRNYDSYVSGIDQMYFSFIITIDQMLEFYSLLKQDSINNSIIEPQEIEESDYLQVEPYTWGGAYDDKILYSSQEGLTLSLSGDVENGDYKVKNIYFGWSIKHLNKKEINDICREYLFRNSSYLFREYEGFLYKKDLIELMRVLEFLEKHLSNEKRLYRIKENLLRSE